jgi:hypothetical protein
MRRRVAALRLASASLAVTPAVSFAADPPVAPSTDEEAPRVDLAVLETAAILGIGTTWYWLDRKTNAQDWDDPPLLARFDGDYWRLDNNRFGINFVGHPLTGALSYGLARAHRIGPAGAFGFALGTSLLWELGVEFREKVSINDVVVTAPAAVPIGELGYKAGVEVAAAFGVEAPRAAQERWRRVRLAVDAGTLACSPLGPASYTRASLEGEIVWIPKYRRRDALSIGFAQAEAVAYRVEVPVSAHGSGVDAEATALLAGLHAQALEGEGDATRGWSVTAGSPLAFRYVASSALGFRELLATTRLPGLELRASLDLPPLRLDASFAANPDFAGLSAPAYEGWLATAPAAVGKTILRRQGYFYGFGPSARARAAIAWGGVELRLEAEGLRVASIDGVDRTQEALTADERVASASLRARAALRVPLAAGWSLGANGETLRMRSRVEANEVAIRADVFALALEWQP